MVMVMGMGGSEVLWLFSKDCLKFSPSEVDMLSISRGYGHVWHFGLDTPINITSISASLAKEIIWS